VAGPERYGITWFVQLLLRVGLIVFIDWAFSNIVPQLLFQTIGKKENLTMMQDLLIKKCMKIGCFGLVFNSETVIPSILNTLTLYPNNPAFMVNESNCLNEN
jgi:hypothetical protein